MSEIKRGEIYYIERDYKTTGSEQIAGRPAIIVSNNKNNENSTTVEVVYLTTQPKADLPTHVTVRGTGKGSIALCEQITTVSTERIGSFSGICNKQEMEAIDTALLISLGISCEPQKEKVVEVVKEVPVEVVKEVPAERSDTMTCKNAETQAKLELMQELYSELLKQTLSYQKGGI